MYMCVCIGADFLTSVQRAAHLWHNSSCPTSSPARDWSTETKYVNASTYTLYKVKNGNILSIQISTSWLMNPYHPWKLTRTWLFSLFSSMSELWATMGVREAQDGKPWLLLDDMRNLVQSVSREGTARGSGKVWSEQPCHISGSL